MLQIILELEILESIPTKKNTLCKKEHRFDEKFKNLSDSQEFYVEGIRHHCAGCAYEQGYSDAKKGKTKKDGRKNGEGKREN